MALFMLISLLVGIAACIWPLSIMMVPDVVEMFLLWLHFRAQPKRP